ncbi:MULTISPECIES: CBS domain-containing protein [unclassified Paenibacillus]|uniref:CBS domain-containing protein n=1 Tax=unclassified Paenibacillus TaxID=185978 RepID=UPI002F3F9382
MKAHEIMISNVYKVMKDDTIRTVVKKFIDHNISGLPVVNDANEIVAYISDGDVMSYIGKHNDIIINMVYMFSYIQGDQDEFEDRIREVLDVNVMRLATKKVLTAQWDDNIEDIAAILGEKQIKKLPVVKNGVLVGVISRGDVIRQSFKGILEEK